jgi:hypothetical protein
MPKFTRLLVLAPLVLVLAAGCTKGNRKANATVNGKVTYNNQPVTGGNIAFHAEGFAGITGLLRPDGTYAATDLPVGVEVTVTIETESLARNAPATYGAGRPGAPGGGAGGAMPIQKPPGGETPVGSGGSEKYVKIPTKFGDKATSPLKKTLSSGSQTWNLELSD